MSTTEVGEDCLSWLCVYVHQCHKVLVKYGGHGQVFTSGHSFGDIEDLNPKPQSPNIYRQQTGCMPNSMSVAHLGKSIWGTPLRTDHDIMAGLIPEVIPKLGFFICPASFYLT